MPRKPNYTFEKQLKETAKQKRKAEKRQRKADKKHVPADSDADTAAAGQRTAEDEQPAE